MNRLAFILLMIPSLVLAKKKPSTHFAYSYTGPAGSFSAGFFSSDDFGTITGNNHQSFNVERDGRSDTEFMLLLTSICDHMGGEGLRE
jgi:hypothetical protein